MRIMIEAKEKECADLLAEVSQLRAEKDEVQRELFNLGAKVRDFEYMVAGKEETIQELQSKLETHDISLASVEEEGEQLRRLVSELEENLSERDSKISQFEDLSKKVEEEKASGSVLHLQEALQKAREDLVAAELEGAQLTSLIQKLEKSCSALTKENADKNGEIQRLKDDLQEAEVVLAEQDTKLKVVQVI